MEIHNHDVNEQKSDVGRSEFDPDKRISIKETGSVGGGSYSDVKKATNSNTHEVHHIPADSVSKLERNDGPAIKMEIADHRKTASWGCSREAKVYRAEQKKLIDEGKFKEAVQMDIKDIHSKFDDKYNNDIDQMLKYVDKLEIAKQI